MPTAQKRSSYSIANEEAPKMQDLVVLLLNWHQITLGLLGLGERLPILLGFVCSAPGVLSLGSVNLNCDVLDCSQKKFHILSVPPPL